MKGNSDDMGLVGKNATYVNAPMVMRGAVSPTALDIARIMPVIIPGRAAGRTWCLIVCHLVAPSAYDASLIENGIALIASRVDRITIGSTRMASVAAPEITLRSRDITRTKRPSPSNPPAIDRTPAK